MFNFRIGSGIDIHRLEPGREFWLGGIQIPHEKGALGHSDADVLIHAICDALLGAAGLGDIGRHFPDTSPEFKGIDSKILLKRVVNLLSEKNIKIINIDSTVCLQRPKIAAYIPDMRIILSAVLNIDVDCISVKATTTEKLGYEGREEGITAYAVALIVIL
jgi:2-C-methyl-D-erythritol 2,4-cyclodiphosphate synthase